MSAKETKVTKGANLTEPKKKSNLPEKPQYKYGVKELAERLGIAPQGARVSLRNHKVEKADGGIYGWNTKAEFDEVYNKLRPPKGEAKAKKAA